MTSIEEWIENKNIEELEERFKEEWRGSGYITNDAFMEEYESEFADFVFATYEEETK